MLTRPINKYAAQAVAEVLDSCGDNIDAAIKRLSELRLTKRANSDAAERAAPAEQSSAAATASSAGAAALWQACGQVSLRLVSWRPYCGAVNAP